jgi:teichuronic acid biosynthesis glycosyltransferase TuaG
LNQSPLVSIIIPTYNRCTYLKETLYSIFSQTYSNFEIIVVSDNSSDETTNMIKGFNDTRCKLYFLNVKSNGPALVRNFGIKMAKGNFIAFCDDDDLWAPDKLSTQIRKITSDDKLVMVATNVKYFGDLNYQFILFSKIKSFINTFPFISPKYLLPFYNCLVISSTLIRKEVMDNYYFNETNDYQGHEDLDLWLKICSTQKALIIKEKLTFYRVHPNQLSNFTNLSYKKQSLKMLTQHFSSLNALQKFICTIRLIFYKLFKY